MTLSDWIQYEFLSKESSTDAVRRRFLLVSTKRHQIDPNSDEQGISNRPVKEEHAFTDPEIPTSDAPDVVEGNLNNQVEIEAAFNNAH
jgi:hypothetical protein